MKWSETWFTQLASQRHHIMEREFVLHGYLEDEQHRADLISRLQVWLKDWRLYFTFYRQHNSPCGCV